MNPSSGDGTGPDADELAATADELGVRLVVLDDDIGLADVAREQALGAASLGMAGGDGSLGPVAAAAMAAGIPFVCIPYGTRNHFALDLGLDREDPVAALDGEAVTLATPITVRSAPGALRMLVPAGAVMVERRGLLRSLFDGHRGDAAE